MNIYCRIDYKKEMVKYIWSTGYVHLHAVIVFSDLEEIGFAVLCFLFSQRTVRFNDSLATPMWEKKGNRGLAPANCAWFLIPVKSVFRVHLVMYQLLELPEARSWAAPCQGRRYTVSHGRQYGSPYHSTNHKAGQNAVLGCSSTDFGLCGSTNRR